MLTPDQVGFGKSSKPQHYQFSFAALAENTLELKDALGIGKSVIVGHSMGGMLATRFALLHPERTTQLLLVNPIGLENYLEYEALTEPLVGWVQGPDRELIALNAALTYDMIFTQPVITEFGDLEVPVALILGTRDRTGPGRG